MAIAATTARRSLKWPINRIREPSTRFGNQKIQGEKESEKSRTKHILPLSNSPIVALRTHNSKRTTTKTTTRLLIVTVFLNHTSNFANMLISSASFSPSFRFALFFYSLEFDVVLNKFKFSLLLILSIDHTHTHTSLLLLLLWLE